VCVLIIGVERFSAPLLQRSIKGFRGCGPMKETHSHSSGFGTNNNGCTVPPRAIFEFYEQMKDKDGHISLYEYPDRQVSTRAGSM